MQEEAFRYSGKKQRAYHLCVCERERVLMDFAKAKVFHEAKICTLLISSLKCNLSIQSTKEHAAALNRIFAFSFPKSILIFFIASGDAECFANEWNFFFFSSICVSSLEMQYKMVFKYTLKQLSW